MSTSTKSLKLDRYTAFYVAASTNVSEDWSKYKSLRNKFTNFFKKEKAEWKKANMDNCVLQSSKTWKNVRNMVGLISGGPTSKNSVQWQIV